VTSGPKLPSVPVLPSGPEEDNAKDLTLPCPKCNAPMPLEEDLCDACGYHRVLKKVIDTTDVYTRDTRTGFERFFSGQISEFESAESALFWVKVIAVIVLVFACFICLGSVGVLLAAAVVGLYFFYAYRIRQKNRETDSPINQDPLSVGVWTVLLYLQRAVGWRLAHWPFPKTRVLVMHDPDFSDEDLGELEGLSEFQTLDFEGVKITDDGLAHLERLKKLRFLVLRRTQVTADAVTRLQRLLPKAWIWY